MKRIWDMYRNKVMQSCNSDTLQREGSLEYWRNLLFARSMVYILPFCLIAIIPAFFLNLSVDIFTILAVDLLSIGILYFIAFASKVPVHVRKVAFTSLTFVFGFALLYMIDNPAPGSIYLYAAVIFALLMYDGKYAWRWCHALLAIYIINALLIYFNEKDWIHDVPMPLLEWLAIVSNVVFLSYLAAALVPRLFTAIQGYIDTQLELQAKLQQNELRLTKATELMHQKNKDLQDFVYVASHDLQEPLRMVNSFMSLLEKKYKSDLPDKAQSYIHYASDGANRMRRMLEDLLRYSRAGKLDEAADWINMDVEMNHFRQLFATEPDHELSWDPMPLLYFPRTALLQICQNLISNGFKYGKSVGKREVHVGFEADDISITLQFTDNGIGIEKEYQSAIFQLFKRLPNQENVQGAGIGLAICKKIIGQLNGSIQITSEFGQGTTMTVYLPKHQLA